MHDRAPGVPTWPVYSLTAAADGTVTLDGPLVDPGPYPGQKEATDAVAAAIEAVQLRRPVRAEATCPDGTVRPLIIDPDGTVTPNGDSVPAVPPPAARLADSTGDPVGGGYARIRAAAESGDLDTAAALAARLDDEAMGAHGPSHPVALRAREVRAHITAQHGDLAAAVRLYRDIAECWWRQGAHTEADEAAGRAHALWLKIEDPRLAFDAGSAVVRMRRQIPGERHRALAAAKRRQSRLEAALAASADSGSGPGHDPGAGPGPAPVPLPDAPAPT